MNKKKIVIFSGAGVSEESGVNTFRGDDGLWEGHKISEVATPQGWKNDPEKVLEFYNARRAQLPTVDPNDAHTLIGNLERDFEVTVVTQNVDDLHERGGSSNVLHLHGELSKVRGCAYEDKDSPIDVVYDIGHEPTKMGDMCETHKTQLRPHIVWYGEMPFHVEEAYQALTECDYLIIVGTSLEITYTISLLGSVNSKAKVLYVDPKPSKRLDNLMEVEYIEDKAVAGMATAIEKINEVENGTD